MTRFALPDRINAALTDATRARLDDAARSAPAEAPAVVAYYDAADLCVAWSLDPEGTIAALAQLTAAQLTVQAIAHTVLMETLGKQLNWRVVEAMWKRAIVVHGGALDAAA